MGAPKLEHGTVHPLPEDFRAAIAADAVATGVWIDITPLARNEWICWVTIVKKAETRREHLERLSVDLKAGKRRPCCWPGCPHRRPNAQKWFDKK